MGPYWSIMMEVCETKQKPVNSASLMEDTVQGAMNTELLHPGDEIVSMFQRRFEYG